MADTAFDPNAPDVELAQAPPPPAPGQPAWATDSEGALLTQPPGAPSAPAPVRAPVSPSAPAPTAPIDPAVAPPGEADQDARDIANTTNDETFRYHNNKLDWRTGRPVAAADLANADDDPRVQQLNQLKQLIPGMAPKEQRGALAQWARENARVRADINRENSQKTAVARAAHVDELRNIDAHFDADPSKRAASADFVNEKVIMPLRQKYLTGVEVNLADPNKPIKADMGDPKVKADYDYNYKTSPLGTMDPRTLRDVVTSIIYRNPGMSNEAAVNIALGVGSPVEMRPEYQQGRPSFNGKPGAQGTNYQVIGGDHREHILLQFPTGKPVRIDLGSYEQLLKARQMGVSAARRFLREQTAARQPHPDLLERTYDWTRRQFQ